MKHQSAWDDTYLTPNPIGYQFMQQAVEPLRDKSGRVRRLAPDQCREMTIKALETYVRIATGDNARRLRVTLRHLRGELPVVPLSFSV